MRDQNKVFVWNLKPQPNLLFIFTWFFNFQSNPFFQKKYIQLSVNLGLKELIGAKKTFED